MKKILIVEDELSLREALKDKLSKNNFEVQLAANGQEAIEIAKDFSPQLILLDILMPGMNGLDVLKEIRGTASLVSVPVIMLTNLPEEGAQEKAEQLGSTEYLVKANTNLEQLIEKINTYVKEE